jgi:hypothetical protein
MKGRLKLGAAILLVILSLGLVEAQFHWLQKLFGQEPVGQRELATYQLGRYLAAHYSGKKAIVFSNPFSQRSGQPREVYAFEKAGLRGLQRGLGTALPIEQVVFPEVKPEFFSNRHAVFIDAATTTPVSYVVTSNAWDSLAQQHPNAEILISLIGFPANVRQTRIWQLNDPHRFALLLPDLRMVGNQAAIREALRTGKIAAMVINKPGAPPEDQPLGKDLQMEFDQRFLLVTPETLDQYLRAYPKLF